MSDRDRWLLSCTAALWAFVSAQQCAVQRFPRYLPSLPAYVPAYVKVAKQSKRGAVRFRNVGTKVIAGSSE